jgi:hypothetical protein
VNDQPDGRFRGRVSGQGQASGAAGPTGPAVGRAWAADWGWNPGADLRPRLPWFGVFLVIFGALLLIEQVVPGTRALGSGFTVAVGVALLIASVVNRRTWQLYLGAIVTAVSLPTLLQDLRIIHEGGGWGTLFLGVALLAIALARAASRAGWGWQLVVGAILAFSGGTQVAEREWPDFPSLDRLVWPALILLLGLALVLRSARRGGLPRR